MHLTIVGYGAIAVDEFQQVDIARTEGQRGCGVEFRLDTHVLGCIGDILDTNLLAYLHGDGVDTLCEGHLQGHGVASEVAVGIGGCPSGFLFLSRIPGFHGEIGVYTTVTRSQALVHGLGIDEELERRTWLALSCHLVVLP